MKKKVVSLCLVALLAMGALIGGTMAYFTDKDKADNVITVGNVDITLDEADVERVDDEWIAQKDRVHGNTYENVFPGAVLPKDPTVHNEGSHDAYVRVKVTVENGMTLLPLYAEDDTLTDSLYNDCFIAMVGNLGQGWEITDGIDANDAIYNVMNSITDATFVITYTPKLGAAADTPPVFEKITIGKNWDQDDLRLTTIQDTGFKVNVVAEAIQAAGFGSATEAWVAFDAQ